MPRRWEGAGERARVSVEVRREEEGVGRGEGGDIALRGGGRDGESGTCCVEEGGR